MATDRRIRITLDNGCTGDVLFSATVEDMLEIAASYELSEITWTVEYLDHV